MRTGCQPWKRGWQHPQEITAMPKMLCTATCQFRCVTRKGTIVDIPDSQLTDPIVQNNFVKSEETAQPPVLNFSNKNPLKESKDAPIHTIGTEKKTADPANAGAGKGNGTLDPNDPPAGTPQDPAEALEPLGQPGDLPPQAPPPPPLRPDFATMTCKELKTWLDANQVQFNTRMLQDELVKLAEKAYALITKE